MQTSNGLLYRPSRTHQETTRFPTTGEVNLKTHSMITTNVWNEAGLLPLIIGRKRSDITCWIKELLTDKQPDSKTTRFHSLHCNEGSCFGICQSCFAPVLRAGCLVSQIISPSVFSSSSSFFYCQFSFSPFNQCFLWRRIFCSISGFADVNKLTTNISWGVRCWVHFNKTNAVLYKSSWSFVNPKWDWQYKSISQCSSTEL